MRGVIFDLDGVLIDSEVLQYRAYSSVLARYGVRVSETEYAAHWIATGEGPEYAVRTFNLPLAPAELRALKAGVYRELLLTEVTLMPGARAALRRLQPRFALAVATNSARDEVGLVIERFRLSSYFTAIVAREDYAAAKPAPDAFATAAARLGLAPAYCLVVEDARRGLLAAQRAGIPVVAVPNSFTRAQDFTGAAAVIDGLDALTVPLVDRLLRTGRETTS